MLKQDIATVNLSALELLEKKLSDIPSGDDVKNLIDSRIESLTFKDEIDVFMNAVDSKINELNNSKSDTSELETLQEVLFEEIDRKIGESSSAANRQIDDIKNDNIALAEKIEKLRDAASDEISNIEKALNEDTDVRISAIADRIETFEKRTAETLDSLAADLRREFHDDIMRENELVEKNRAVTEKILSELPAQKEAFEAGKADIEAVVENLTAKVESLGNDYADEIALLKKSFEGIDDEYLQSLISKTTDTLKQETEQKLKQQFAQLEEKKSEIDEALENVRCGMDEQRTKTEETLSALKESINNINVESIKSELNGAVLELDERLTALFLEGYEDVRSQVETLPEFIDKKLDQALNDRVTYDEFKELRSHFGVLKNEIADLAESVPRAEELQSLRELISRKERELYEDIKSEVEEKIDGAMSSVREELTEFNTSFEKLAADLSEDIERKMEDTVTNPALREALAAFKTGSEIDEIISALNKRVDASNAEFKELSRKVFEEIENKATDFFSAGDFEEVKNDFRNEIDTLFADYRKSIDGLSDSYDSRLVDLESRLKFAMRNSADTLGQSLRGEINTIGERGNELAGRLEEMVSGNNERNEAEIAALRAELEEKLSSILNNSELEQRLSGFDENIRRISDNLKSIPDAEELLKVKEQALQDISSQAEDIKEEIQKRLPAFEEKMKLEFEQQKNNIDKAARETIDELKENVNEVDDRLSALFHEGYEDFRRTADEMSVESIGAIRKRLSDIESAAERFVSAERFEFAIRELTVKADFEEALEEQSARLKKYCRERIDESADRGRIDELLESLREEQEKRLSEYEEKEGRKIAEIEDRLDAGLSMVPDIEALQARIEKTAAPDDLESLRKEIMESLLSRLGDVHERALAEIDALKQELRKSHEESLSQKESLAAGFEQRVKELQNRFENLPIQDEFKNLRAEFESMLNEKIVSTETALMSRFDNKEQSAELKAIDEKIRNAENTFEKDNEKLADSIAELGKEIDSKIAELSSVVEAELEAKLSTLPLIDRDTFNSGLAEIKQQVESRLELLEKSSVDKTEIPDSEKMKSEILESVENHVEEMLEKATAEKPQTRGIDESKVVELVKKATEEMRDDMLEDLIELIPGDEEQTNRKQFDDFRDTITESIVAQLRGIGVVRLLMDPKILARTAEGLPESANEEQIARFVGKELEKKIIGKKCAGDIVTDDGVCVVKKGEIVDAGTIKHARDNGKFIELTLNVVPNDQAGHADS